MGYICCHTCGKYGMVISLLLTINPSSSSPLSFLLLNITCKTYIKSLKIFNKKNSKPYNLNDVHNLSQGPYEMLIDCNNTNNILCVSVFQL